TNIQPIEITEWWATFRDPELTSLIRRAAHSNLDLRQAESRIRSARWSRVIAGSGQYPTVNLGAGYLGARGSENVTFHLAASAPAGDKKKAAGETSGSSATPTGAGAGATSSF